MLYRITLLWAAGIGLLIAYIDSRPNWDDTGITAGLIFLISLICAAFFPQRPWLWALAVGLSAPLVATITSQNYASWLALVVAVAGAYAGALVRTTVPIMVSDQAARTRRENRKSLKLF